MCVNHYAPVTMHDVINQWTREMNLRLLNQNNEFYVQLEKRWEWPPSWVLSGSTLWRDRW